MVVKVYVGHVLDALSVESGLYANVGPIEHAGLEKAVILGECLLTSHPARAVYLTAGMNRLTSESR